MARLSSFAGVRRKISALLFLFLFLQAPARADISLTSCTEDALRTAISSGGIIRLDCTNARITLTRPIVVATDTTLVTTQAAIAISGAGSNRLFVVQPGIKFTVQAIGLFGGRQTATNINNGGVPEIAGGAIYNDGGTVTLLSSVISGHSAVGFTGADGANGTPPQDGENGGDSAGGAIFQNSGTLIISNCVFEANSVSGGNGGKGGNATGQNVNGANGGNGGIAGGSAIYARAGTVLLYGSTFTNNAATGAIGGAAGTPTGFLSSPGRIGDSSGAFAGAIYSEAAYMVVNACTFIGNKVTGGLGNSGANGFGANPGGEGKNGGFAAGGAIYNNGALLLTNSTFVANATLGGVGGAGGAAGASLFGQDGGPGGAGGTASGGAIENNFTASVINCTFSANTATGGQGGAGGAPTGIGRTGRTGSAGLTFGAAIFGSAGTVELGNTIIADNGSSPNLSGTITDRGGNISSDNSFNFTAATSRSSTNPQLQPLSDNGGLTLTMAISTNSPAFNTGVASFAPKVDQRGTNRTTSVPDSGAFEIYIAPPPPPPPPAPTVSASIVNTNLIVLQWPGSSNFVVEVTTNVGPSIKYITNIITDPLLPILVTNITTTNIPGANWTAATNIPTVLRGVNVLTFPILTNTNRYFRLRSN